MGTNKVAVVVVVVSLQYDVNNFGIRFLYTCYANFWWIPSETLSFAEALMLSSYT